MSLTLVAGRPNAGKTGVLYGVVRRSAAEGASPVVVLPSRPDARLVAREFAVCGPKLGVMATTLDDYVDDLWTAHGDGRGVVGGVERRILLAQATRRCDLRELKESATGQGFPRLLEPAAAGGVEHIDVTRASSGVAAEISAVLLAYRRLLDDAYLVERGDASHRLERIAEPSWFTGPIVANRFSDLTPLQERFLVAAANHCEVWLALPWQRGLSATRALDELVERLIATGARLHVEPARQYTESDELRYMEAHLFDQTAGDEKTPRCGDVRLSLAYGQEAEAHRIAAEVQTALEEGVLPEQVAVVFEDVREHAGALRRAFAEAGTPAEFDIILPARDTGWGRALDQLASFAMRGERSDLTGFLRTPYAGVAQDVAERLEARWRRFRVERPDRLLASLRSENRSASSVVARANALFSADGKGVGSAQDAANWKELADTLMRNAYGGTGAILEAEGLADASAHRAFLRLVESTVALPEIQNWSAALVDAFRQTEVTVVSPPTDGAVRVMSASRARSQRFQVVIVGGLAAGDFPKPPVENPLRLPDMAADLAKIGLGLPRKDERDAARLTFYLVASRATKRLVLSRQVASSDGTDLRASWLLEEVLDLYRSPDAEEVDEEKMPPVSVLGYDEQGISPGAPVTPRREMRDAAGNGRTSPNEHVNGELELARRRAARREPVLADDRVLAELSERQVFSVTEIESYLRCPYGWFHDRVVRATALDPDEDALQRGRLCHEALRRLYELLPDAVGSARVSAANLDEVLALAGGVIDAVAEAEGEATALAQMATEASVRRKVLGFLRADAAFMPHFEPIALEFAFGPDEGRFDGFALRGRMDRIDRGPDGELVVVDYKSGTVGAGYSAAKFEKHGLLQLALYSRIASEALGAPIAAGLYRGVSGQNVRAKANRGFYTSDLAERGGLVGTDAMSAEEMGEVVRGAEVRAAEAVGRMREGRIPAEPLDPKACQTCKLRGFCPRSRR